jgi:hypothetical protein
LWKNLASSGRGTQGFLGMAKEPEQYDEKEAQSRFEAALRVA